MRFPSTALRQSADSRQHRERTEPLFGVRRRRNHRSAAATACRAWSAARTGTARGTDDEMAGQESDSRLFKRDVRHGVEWDAAFECFSSLMTLPPSTVSRTGAPLRPIGGEWSPSGRVATRTRAVGPGVRRRSTSRRSTGGVLVEAVDDHEPSRRPWRGRSR